MIRNSRYGREWEHEEREPNYFNPFKEGQEFRITIKIEDLFYVIFINGIYFCDYRHRYRYKEVFWIHICGEIEVRRFEYRRESVPTINSEPMLTSSIEDQIENQILNKPV